MNDTQSASDLDLEKMTKITNIFCNIQKEKNIYLTNKSCKSVDDPFLKDKKENSIKSTQTGLFLQQIIASIGSLLKKFKSNNKNDKTEKFSFIGILHRIGLLFSNKLANSTKVKSTAVLPEKGEINILNF